MPKIKENSMHAALICSLVVLLCMDFVESLTKFYMEDDCHGDIAMEASAIPAGRLSVTRRTNYRSTLTCHVTITAPLDRKIVVTFREMDIEWEPNCDDDYVSLHDGSSNFAPILVGTKPRMCGHVIPPGNYITSGNKLTVLFQSDVHKQNNGFEIVFTAFHKSKSCFVDELRCGNGRCIAASLRCNNFNNCGDSSDECEVDAEVFLALLLSVFLLTVVGVGALQLYKKRKRKHSNKKERAMKAAISKIYTMNTTQDGIEIHPCYACSLKILSAEKQKRRASNVRELDRTETYDEEMDMGARAYKEHLEERFSENRYRASI